MASKRTGLQPLRMKPLTGSFDSRSMPELVAVDAWRLLQNTRTTARGKLCRLPGWEKFLAGLATHRGYNNEDLHDQLLRLQIYYDAIADVDDAGVVAYPPNNASFGDFCGTTEKLHPQGRQPITFGAEVTSSLGTRHCLAGTQSRLYTLNFGQGNWKIIADGLGGTQDNPEVRFQHAALGDYVFFTNNFDEVFYWRIDQAMSGCAMQSVQHVPELREIGVTKVRCLASFKGTLFFGNVEQDGERRANRIIWSRYQAPLEVVEDPGVSTAGTQDLDFGEEIIGMRELGDFLYVYTNRAIWLTVVTGGEATFVFVRKYRAADEGDGTLVYPFTLTGSKDSHFYGSKDGIYEWNPFIMAPIRQEWIHLSSNILYDHLNESACAAHTAGYDPKTKELWFSFAQGESMLPSISLTCNTAYQQCSKVDHGFTCFFNFTPDTRESVRDWLMRNCVVSEECLDSIEFRELGFFDPKQGPDVSETSPSCPQSVNHIYTGEELVVGSVAVEETERSMPDLDHMGFTKWVDDVSDRVTMDLIGEGTCGDVLQDVWPGNGLYIRPNVPFGPDRYFKSTAIPIVSGATYKIEMRLAGNNSDATSDAVDIFVDMAGMPGGWNIPAVVWNAPFSTITHTFESAMTGDSWIEIQFTNTDPEAGNLGPIIDRVRVVQIDPETEQELAVVFDDNFDNENITEPPCTVEEDVVTEDYTQPEASDDSLCALLGDQSIAEGCRNCDAAPVFVAASATDWCLKQIGTIYARERFEFATWSVGQSPTYVLDGYDTILLKGPMTFGTDSMKALSNDPSGGGAVQLEFSAEPQTTPTNIRLRVGACHRCDDPLNGCAIKWYEEEPRPIVCRDDDRKMEWAAFAVDYALYLEFKIAGTGGASCYSSLQVVVGPGGC